MKKSIHLSFPLIYSSMFDLSRFVFQVERDGGLYSPEAIAGASESGGSTDLLQSPEEIADIQTEADTLDKEVWRVPSIDDVRSPAKGIDRNFDAAFFDGLGVKAFAGGQLRAFHLFGGEPHNAWEVNQFDGDTGRRAGCQNTLKLADALTRSWNTPARRASLIYALEESIASTIDPENNLGHLGVKVEYDQGKNTYIFNVFMAQGVLGEVGSVDYISNVSTVVGNLMYQREVFKNENIQFDVKANAYILAGKHLGSDDMGVRTEKYYSDIPGHEAAAYESTDTLGENPSIVAASANIGGTLTISPSEDLDVFIDGSVSAWSEAALKSMAKSISDETKKTIQDAEKMARENPNYVPTNNEALNMPMKLGFGVRYGDLQKDGVTYTLSMDTNLTEGVLNLSETEKDPRYFAFLKKISAAADMKLSDEMILRFSGVAITSPTGDRPLQDFDINARLSYDIHLDGNGDPLLTFWMKGGVDTPYLRDQQGDLYRTVSPNINVGFNAHLNLRDNTP